jgi:hypothetical protein
MAVLTAPLKNGGDILGECHFARRSGWFGPQGERHQEANSGWDQQCYPDGSPAVTFSNLHRTHSLRETCPVEQDSPDDEVIEGSFGCQLSEPAEEDIEGSDSRPSIHDEG